MELRQLLVLKVCALGHLCVTVPGSPDSVRESQHDASKLV